MRIAFSESHICLASQDYQLVELAKVLMEFTGLEGEQFINSLPIVKLQQKMNITFFSSMYNPNAYGPAEAKWSKTELKIRIEEIENVNDVTALKFDSLHVRFEKVNASAFTFILPP
jgi:hypothetical protein